MSSQEVVEITATLSDADREQLVLRYWRRGDLTPLKLANALARRPQPRTASR